MTIFEIRALNSEALKIFDDRDNLARLGPALAGVHWETDFAFIFFKDEAGPDINGFLNEHPELELRHVHHLTYGQWQDGAGAAPFQVAGLTIAGPGGQGDGPGLIIDPGLAFGFGGHPTTRACLEFLARVCRSRSGPPRTALDLGSGTGVLSLAAAVWGVEKVVGVDYSHLAADAALNNLHLNRLEEKVEFRHGPAQAFAGHEAELLMANLHLSLQEELLEKGAFNKRKAVIISGLLPSEGASLFEKLSAGFRLVDQIRTDRWISLLLASPETVI